MPTLIKIQNYFFFLIRIMQKHKNSTKYQYFPKTSKCRVFPIVGVYISSSYFPSSHLYILSSSYLLIFASSHPHIFTSSHLHIFSSSHLLILTSSHLPIFTSSYLHTFSSSHLLIFTSSHLHILTSSHLHIFTSSHPHIFTSSHLHIFPPSHSLLPSCSLALFFFLLFYFSLEARDSANETTRNATLSHETRFDRQKLR